jgi:hypothetical protein
MNRIPDSPGILNSLVSAQSSDVSSSLLLAELKLRALQQKCPADFRPCFVHLGGNVDVHRLPSNSKKGWDSKMYVQTSQPESFPVFSAKPSKINFLAGNPVISIAGIFGFRLLFHAARFNHQL